MALDDDAVGANDQKSSQGSLAHLRRGPETLLAPCRMLPRCQAEPRGEVARLAERLRWRRQDCDRSGDQGANAGHCHEPAGHLVLLGPPGDLGIELADLRLEMGEAATKTWSVSMASPGKPFSGSSTMAISRAAFAAPCGTICPNSPK